MEVKAKKHKGIIMSLQKAFTVGWLLILLVLLGYELYAALDNRGATPTLTQLVVGKVPAEITLAFLFWLWLHFFLRYAGKLLRP